MAPIVIIIPKSSRTNSICGCVINSDYRWLHYVVIEIKGLSLLLKLYYYNDSIPCYSLKLKAGIFNKNSDSFLEYYAQFET